MINAKAIYYRPVLKYYVNNITCIQQVHIANTECRYYIGQKVEIYCNPIRPDNIALVDTGAAREYTPFIITGILLFAAGLII